MSNVKTVFRTLAHEVHPDHGGNSAQFIEIMKYRNDYDRLVALASKWGIKLDGIDTSKSYQENLEAVVGALIRHTFTYKRDAKSLYGVIFNIRKITKGYRKGAKEFKVFDLESGTIWTLKTYEKQPFNAVVGMADVSQLEAGKRVDDAIKTNKKHRAQIKQNLADQQFARLGLAKNKNYYSHRLEVLVRYRGDVTKWERLMRTTPKSVYIHCFGYKNDERRIPVASVIKYRRVY